MQAAIPGKTVRYNGKQQVGAGRMLFLLLFLIIAITAAGSAQAEKASGDLIGEVREVETGETVGWSVLLLDEIGRSVSGHDDGSYHFYDVPAGSYTLKVFRIGYLDVTTNVRIYPDSVSEKVIYLTHNRLLTENIVVEADSYSGKSEMEKPEIDVSGKKLRQNLGRTIAETIQNEPGISQRSMGPAPARPVMRGMSGDRLLILEDGERVGDLSATSADHAVAIEPMSTERIEVVRGPAALKYGANALGGVINVVRDYIPTAKPHRFTGTASMQGESVNKGLSAGTRILVPIGTLALHFDASQRNARDVTTPSGDLVNTDIRTTNSALGISYVKPWGYFGMAGGYYDTEYGIPPDPFGGHPGGVDIDLRRRHFETRGAVYPKQPWFRRVQFHYSFSQYYHAEYEANGNLGIEYGVLSHFFKTQVNLCWFSFLNNCEYGFWGGYRDFGTGGLSFSPDTKEYTLAGYFYTEFKIDKARFSTILRYDRKTITPDKRKPSPETGLIRERYFDGLSAGLSGKFPLTGGFSGGLSVIKTFRSPQIEELFSEGPHLAAYSFEIGNADLQSESGLGMEASLMLDKTPLNGRLSVFRNRVDDYIFPVNTGRKSYYRDDLFVYRYAGIDALLQGAEMSFDWNVYRQWSVNGSFSYVHGTLEESGEPIPYMPPFSQQFGLVYRSHFITVNATMRSALRQDRLGENENLVPQLNPDGTIKLDSNGDITYASKPTDGFGVFDIGIDYYLKTGRFLSTLNVTVENITDRVYRRHLNRVKEIMPEPGRNIKVLYKIYF